MPDIELSETRAEKKSGFLSEMEEPEPPQADTVSVKIAMQLRRFANRVFIYCFLFMNFADLLGDFGSTGQYLRQPFVEFFEAWAWLDQSPTLLSATSMPWLEQVFFALRSA